MTASDASMFSFRDLRNEPDPILKQELRDDLMMPTIVIDNGELSSLCSERDAKTSCSVQTFGGLFSFLRGIRAEILSLC